MLRIIFLFWLLPSMARSAVTDLEAVQHIERLKLLYHADPERAEIEARELSKVLNKEQTPRAWLQIFPIVGLQSYGASIHDELRKARQLAQKLQLTDEEAMLIVFECGLIQDQAPRSEVEALYAEATRLAQIRQDKITSGQIWSAQAAYYFYQADTPKGLQAINAALRYFKDLQGEDLVYYYDGRSILASLWTEQGEGARAIPLDRENLAWFIEHKIHFQAARMAYNLAIGLLAKPMPDFEEVDRLLSISDRFARAIRHKERMGDVLYGRGKMLLFQKHFAASAAQFKQASDLYAQVPNREFLILCKMYEARALLGLGRNTEAQAVLDAGKRLIKPENSFEYELELETRIEVLQALGQHRQALAAMDEYLSFQAKVKDEQKAQDLQKLSTSLGLQIEEARRLTLERENELQNQKLEDAKKQIFFAALLSLFAVGIGILTFTLIRQNRRLQRRRATIQRILDHIDEGLLLINRQQLIGHEYSRQLNVLLEQTEALGGRSFRELVLDRSSLTNEQKAMIQEVLAAGLGEDIVSWHFNEGNLPGELPWINGRLLSIRWIPVTDAQNIVQRVLVSLQDMSQQRRLEEEIARLDSLQTASFSLCGTFAQMLRRFLPGDRIQRIEVIDRFLHWTPQLKSTVDTYLDRAIPSVLFENSQLGFRLDAREKDGKAELILRCDPVFSNGFGRVDSV